MHGEVAIQQLEYLVALARERHFGRAASACHVSQPTLSVAIRRLEHELDVVIVLRGQRFEGFTAEGQRVVTWAHRILAERNELLADVERMRGGLTVTARIGAVPTSVPASPLVTGRFLERYPGARGRIEAVSCRESPHRVDVVSRDRPAPGRIRARCRSDVSGRRNTAWHKTGRALPGALCSCRAFGTPAHATLRSALDGGGRASAVRVDHGNAQPPHHRRQ